MSVMLSVFGVRASRVDLMQVDHLLLLPVSASSHVEIRAVHLARASRLHVISATPSSPQTLVQNLMGNDLTIKIAAKSMELFGSDKSPSS